MKNYTCFHIWLGGGGGDPYTEPRVTKTNNHKFFIYEPQCEKCAFWAILFFLGGGGWGGGINNWTRPISCFPAILLPI